MSDTSPSLDSPRPFPASGLFRIFPYEAISWRQRIRQSGLPADAQDLISAVVRKSRLMRFEKIEVVQELISHFLEGRQSGQSYPQLVANFGDPQITATLIRRSKIRNRPMMMKLLHLSGWSGLTIVATWLIIVTWFHLGKPQPTTDFMVEFNQPIRESDEQDKAWPIYRSVWTKFGFSDGGEFSMREFYYHDGNDDFKRLIKPTDPGWPDAVAKLDELNELLDVFRRAARLPKLGLELQADTSKYADEDFAALFPHRTVGIPYQQWQCDGDKIDDDVEQLLEGSVVGVLLPHVYLIRQAASLLQVDTRWAVEQNDSERAVANIESMFGLAKQAAEGNFFVCGITGLGIHYLAYNQLEEVLVEDPEFFDADQLERLQKRIAITSVRDLIKFDCERAAILDIIQRVYTDDGNGDGRITPIGLKLLTSSSQWFLSMSYDTPESELGSVVRVGKAIAAPASMFTVASRKQTIEKFNEIIDSYVADHNQPFWLAEHPDFDDFLQNNSQRFMVLGMLMPAFQQICNTMDRTIARQEAVIAALAIHRYHLRHGKWPDAIEQLSPEFVAEIPVDIINGDFVRFKIDDQGPLIYSVGNDRDDDGGIQPVMIIDDGVTELRQPIEFFMPVPKPAANSDGDWILWPQSNDLK